MQKLKTTDNRDALRNEENHITTLSKMVDGSWEQEFKLYFQANLLDGDDVDDCGKAMLDAKEALEVCSEFIKQERLKIKTDLFAIADSGDFENLRRETEEYFKE